jgi:hypothetical protein
MTRLFKTFLISVDDLKAVGAKQCFAPTREVLRKDRMIKSINREVLPQRHLLIADG